MRHIGEELQPCALVRLFDRWGHDTGERVEQNLFPPTGWYLRYEYVHRGPDFWIWSTQQQYIKTARPPDGHHGPIYQRFLCPHSGLDWRVCGHRLLPARCPYVHRGIARYQLRVLRTTRGITIEDELQLHFDGWDGLDGWNL